MHRQQLEVSCNESVTGNDSSMMSSHYALQPCSSDYRSHLPCVSYKIIELPFKVAMMICGALHLSGRMLT